MNKKTIAVCALAVFLFAAYFRLRGVNWDEGQHLHPDERFLTMVTQGISWPKDIQAYLDTSTSPLNPHNQGFGFFVYGTLPIFFTKFVVDLVGKNNYGDVTIVGRQLSALVDIGTVVLVYLIAKQVVKSDIRKTRVSLLSSFFYASMVLPIQLSHFYAVDTYVTFFLTFSFYLLNRLLLASSFSFLTSIALGISFGFALASKITAILFLPIIGLGFLWCLATHKNRPRVLVFCFLFAISCFLAFRFTQPYLFANSGVFDVTLNAKVIENWKQLESFDDASGGFPPAVQWITTKPYVFPLKNMVYWGLGIPLAAISLFSLMYVAMKGVRQGIVILLSFLWIFGLFFYQGAQFVKALRYFYSIYPFLALLSGYAFSQFFVWVKNHHPKLLFVVFCFLFLAILYPFSFTSMYSRPHTRIAASEWIYNNVPAGSFKSDEHWDDGLPLSLPTEGFIHEKYTGVEFPLYWPDNREKWSLMVENLQKVNYIFLTSNRLYGSLMTLPEKYPVTARYYATLFDGSLGFEKVAEFTSRPNIPIPFLQWCINLPGARYGIVAKASAECPLLGISLVDDEADETFTVYDHPKVIIFKKVKKNVNYASILGVP